MTRRLLRVAHELWLPLTVLVVWWTLSAGSTSTYFPSLETIANAFADTWLFERAQTDLLPTVWRFAAAFAIAVVVGVGLGLVIGIVPLLYTAVKPLIDFFRTLPKSALIPLAILFLGVDSAMKIAIAAFGALWPILLNTIDGVRGVEPTQLEMARVYGLSRRDRQLRLILPAASPQIFAGFRVALPIALTVMVVAEMLAATDGLGYFVILQQNAFAIPEMWSGMIVLGLMGYGAAVLLGVVEDRVLAWHKGWRDASRGQTAASRLRLTRGAAKQQGER